MQYPEYFTADDIMEFEYEYNRYLDREDPNSLIAVNEELQLIAKEQKMDFENDYEPGYHDELERDWDEPYEPVTGCDPAEYNDDWYDDQYEVDYSDF